MRRFHDCGHEWTGATDSGWCRRCEEAYRDQQYEAEARAQSEQDAMAADAEARAEAEARAIAEYEQGTER